MNRQGRILAWLKRIGVMGIALLLLATLLAPAGLGQALAQGTPATGTATTTAPTMTPVEVAKKVSPAVVTVINKQAVSGTGLNGNTNVLPAASGSGFFIDQQGHIVTNNHVVAGGQQFVVIFADGSRHDAKLVGTDPISDLAVLKVSGPVPGVVPLGNSDALQPGQPVLAIGSPLGLSFTGTVTEGIVSALGRSVSEQQGQPELTGLIQHDAPINPGNSGGPLVNLQGQVVGVNTLGIPSEQGVPVQGIFFAIPVNHVKEVASELIANGKVVYPYLGILNPVEISPEVAAINNLPVNHGAYVTSVVSGGPSAKAGITQGDIILAIDGQSIDAKTPLAEVLFQHKPGQTVKVKLQRGSQQLMVSLTLGTRPANAG